ncbi:TIGR00366 family protein [Parageobacillus thermoglucosidasius]|uniref:TIGR00366 family protein n=1 Tax=Parageobacillus thermoglucosidasius TaxID=1426 RepID=UPI00241E1BCC|nr:TIGR00366 family protein [Parageobacillus thermoglucosidasius]
MLRSISQRFNVGVEKYLPDAFIFAIILTFITYIMGIVLAGQTPLAMIALA